LWTFVDFQGETTTVIDFGVGRHTLVSREDHPDSPSFFRIAADTALDPFKGIRISQEVQRLALGAWRAWELQD
jgi:hypothetical protein